MPASLANSRFMAGKSGLLLWYLLWDRFPRADAKLQRPLKVLGQTFGTTSKDLLGLEPHVLQEFLFDSVEDFQEIVSGGPTGNTVSRTLQDFVPHFDDTRFQWMLSWWSTPAQAWGQGEFSLPKAVRQVFENHTKVTCKKFCKGDGTGACCKPVQRCMRLDYILRQAFRKTLEDFMALETELKELQLRSMASSWPFASLTVVPLLRRALRVVDEFMWFVVFIWSRAGSNPTLLPCMSSRYGQMLKYQHLEMVKRWRQLRRSEEAVTWEIVATSRIGFHNWSHLGIHFTSTTEMLRKMTGLLIVQKKFFSFFDQMLRETSWQAMVSGSQSDERTGSSEELLGGTEGEYPTIHLARYQFLTDCGDVRNDVDRGVMRFLIRHVFDTDDTVGEFGAFAGHNCEWLNETGLVQAFAYDGMQDMGRLTDGTVQTMKLGEPVDLERTFDWILCLEVGEHMPPGSEDALMDNIYRHAKTGLVMSWATHDYPLPDHPNTKTPAESMAIIVRHGFQPDMKLTEKLRASADFRWHSQSIAVYYKVYNGSLASKADYQDYDDT
eukprot:TRINITY_DN40505_c0_g1_i2.p1 TRINITY_DN40505_c0_g1~~TRINITY_DN40505_c0_g1_i2.p1  ORF type:complete len:551 (-),score=111.04 TRINITY_DN40505_c0_g1_i2:658-2310(-)